jgi:hypothetical protein
MSDTKFIVLHEVSLKHGITKYLAPIGFIRLLIDAERYAATSIDGIEVPSGARTFVQYIDSSGSWVEETLDEIQKRLEDVRLTV